MEIVITYTLREFLISVWNDAEQTCGNSRYHRGLDCWLMKSKKNIPKYLKHEYQSGRILVSDIFPKCSCDNIK
jgi:hypothetical protein